MNATKHNRFKVHSEGLGNKDKVLGVSEGIPATARGFEPGTSQLRVCGHHINSYHAHSEVNCFRKIM